MNTEMTFPFSEISDAEFNALHPYNYTLQGNPEMVFYNGVWYSTGDEDPLDYVDPWQDEVYDMILLE